MNSHQVLKKLKWLEIFYICSVEWFGIPPRHLCWHDKIVKIEIRQQGLVIGIQFSQSWALNQISFVHLEDVILLHWEHGNSLYQFL